MYKKLFITKLFILTVLISIVISFCVILPVQANENIIENSTISDENSNENGKIIGFLGEDEINTISNNNSPGNVVEHIMGHTFYIKNAYSGQYMDVEDSKAADSTNVIQYPLTRCSKSAMVYKL